MSYIKIKKEDIEQRIAELEAWIKEYDIIDTTHQKGEFVKTLKSILQQGEECEENETVEYMYLLNDPSALYGGREFIGKQEESTDWDDILNEYYGDDNDKQEVDSIFFNWLKEHYTAPKKR